MVHCGIFSILARVRYKLKILITDPIGKDAIAMLTASGHEVEVADELTQEQLINKVKLYDALIVRSKTQVSADVIRAGTNLKVIARAGVGTDNIDCKTANERGIIVVNAPGGTTTAVAELVIGLMIAIARHIPHATASVKSGKWEKKKFMGSELQNKILGIIGVGRIGSAVATRANAFGMKCIAYDPYVDKNLVTSTIEIELVTLDELLTTADFITLHVPLTPETKHMLSDAEFKKMKSTAYLINCARGGVVDERALYIALKTRQIAGAALDVFEREPPPPELSPLLTLDNVIFTPHLGASTIEAQSKVGIIVAEQVLKVLRGEKPDYEVIAAKK
jgi:D-3-phosphoglycerate dehydrogenase